MLMEAVGREEMDRHFGFVSPSQPGYMFAYSIYFIQPLGSGDRLSSKHRGKPSSLGPNNLKSNPHRIYPPCSLFHS
jgi:hypothetical protein